MRFLQKIFHYASCWNPTIELLVSLVTGSKTPRLPYSMIQIFLTSVPSIKRQEERDLQSYEKWAQKDTTKTKEQKQKQQEQQNKQQKHLKHLRSIHEILK